MEAHHEELRVEVDNGSGNSVVVPVIENVGALSLDELEDKPRHYLQPHEDENDVVEVEDSTYGIPVIDMNKLLDQHADHDELARLHSACKDWGFFQLINHGVPEEVIEKMKIDIEKFLALPLEEKKAYAQLPNSFEGYGHDWTDRLFLLARPISQRNMRFWPTHPTSFKENLYKYLLEMHKLSICLLKFMSKNLGLDSETFTNMFEQGRQSVRINLYPTCGQANKVMGLGPHSDASGLSLVLQVNDVQGLQIKRNRKWVPIKAIPGVYIVNIGDLIEIMTNGEYKSIEHRVVVNSEKHRLSIGAFAGPDLKAIIGPVPDLLKHNRPNYKSILHADYLKSLYQGKNLNSKSLIDQLKLEK